MVILGVRAGTVVAEVVLVGDSGAVMVVVVVAGFFVVTVVDADVALVGGTVVVDAVGGSVGEDDVGCCSVSFVVPRAADDGLPSPPQAPTKVATAATRSGM